MFKYLKRTFLFSLFFLIIYVLLLFAWQNLAPRALNRNFINPKEPYSFFNNTVSDIDHAKNIDILFLGSSHMYRGCDPRIFEKYGLNVFNLGSSSQTPLQTKILLNKYLEHLNPKLVIYDIYPLTLTFDGLESSIDLLKSSGIDASSLEILWQSNHIKCFNAFIYFATKQFVFDENVKRVNVDNKDYVYIKKGYVQSAAEINPDTLLFGPNSDQMKPKQQKAFQDILSEINRKKIPLLLIQIPVTKKFESTIQHRDKFEEFIQAQNQFYINFNNELELSDKYHFADYHHLNQKGVELFNKALIDTLIKHKMLPNYDLH